ncbi:MAG: aminopeptidase P family N-terminal domain-containing protein [Atopobiaceae bacterium]|jgi:Xaa-Pro aminopeptidase|nr:aminopeptidase P family N-terminal domain-containing protein [Atopobiaceae bacterium]MCH4119597.1 aminopeptidase P family N-terminal domain-containing protein [Atopobiaceae bacterium]MCI1318036.1 aminopeptidase P family N-terminal domain-containing protein [Atopobiaceae bacterium]MCI1389632.1 aminopeptidase P family N-terminal domain-containing protein [Atopobiaceae bacterium]MCI1431582.1 aminopeptidase P family N-terminal domain-containing protein [Atopobiaceae bacterium]
MQDIKDVILAEVPEPARDCAMEPVPLTDSTMQERKAKVLAAMREKGLDSLVVYADMEHGGNFEYLVGYLPRFEEALLVAHSTGELFLLLGNETLNKGDKARLAATSIHTPFFSLANQPMAGERPLADVLRDAGLAGKRCGVAGWKLFTSATADDSRLFDIPAYTLDALFEVCGKENVANATDVFIGPHGVRRTCNANELAHYEFGASLASDAVLDAMDALEPGVTEVAVADGMQRLGQHPTVITIATFGPRFVNANLYPTANALKLGQSVSLTIGYKGGTSSRAGYGVRGPEELDASLRGYVDELAIPYFHAITAMLSEVHVGMTGGELYELVEGIFPKSEFGWKLNPSHLTADEEWLCSPVSPGSDEPLESGMMIQTDLIPSVAPYAGVSMESTYALADERLQAEMAAQYPAMWERFQQRRRYIQDVQHVALSPEVMPLASTLAYIRPYLLSRAALCYKG